MFLGRLIVARSGERAFEQLVLQPPLPVIALSSVSSPPSSLSEQVECQLAELALQLAAPEPVALPLAILQRQVEIAEGDAVVLGQAYLLQRTPLEGDAAQGQFGPGHLVEPNSTDL